MKLISFKRNIILLHLVYILYTGYIDIYLLEYNRYRKIHLLTYITELLLLYYTPLKFRITVFRNKNIIGNLNACEHKEIKHLIVYFT